MRRSILVIAVLGCQGSPREAPAAAPSDNPHAFLDRVTVEEPEPVAPPPNALAGPSPHALVTSSGLHSEILVASTSTERPTRADIVVMTAEIWDAHGGHVESYTTNEAFSLADGMPGMLEGILLMRKGERRRLWIDERLQGTYRLAPGTIVCDVELADIVRAP